MGTTAEKLTYLNETKTKLKDMLNLGGASLTTEPFRQYVDTLKNRYLYFINNGTQEVWDNWEKVVGEGTTITLNNTEEAPMTIVLKGNTSQETTTGKNKLPNVATSQTIQDVQYIVNSDGSVKVNGTASANGGLFLTGGINEYIDLNIANGNYILNGCSNGAYDGLSLYLSIKHSDNTTTELRQTTSALTFTKQEGDLFYALIRVGSRTQVNNQTIYPMIRATGESNTYEPYTGAKASPNPDYPQDIHVVSGDNSIEVGNNVFDISTITPNSFIDNNGNIYASFASNLSDYIEVKENDIILSYDYTSLVSTSTRAYCWFDSNKNFISGHLYSPVNKTNTFNVVSGAKYIRFTYDKNISNIKVSNQSASYPISLGDIELCKIGTYQDKIDNSSGKWYLNKQIGKVVLNGSENSWVKYSALDTTNNNCYYIPLDTLYVDSTGATKVCLSNYFTGVSFNDKGTDTANMWGSKYAKQLYLKIKNTITTIGELQTWLSSNNVEVRYVLSTPTYTEITDSTLLSQLNALAKSYASQTNISQTNNDLPFIINAIALREMA